MTIISTKGQSSAYSQKVKRMHDVGEIRRIYNGIYTDELHKSDEEVVRENILSITSILVPGAVISFKSGYTLKPDIDGNFFVVSQGKTRNIELPGCKIHIINGMPPIKGDMPLLNGSLFLASAARLLVENMYQNSRNRNKTKLFLESRMVDDFEAYGESYITNLISKINDISELSKKLVPACSASIRMAKAVIGGEYKPEGKRLSMFMSGEPFDLKRVRLFATLAMALTGHSFEHIKRENVEMTKLPFFEAYFSNYIEGTRMSVNDAESVLSGANNNVPKGDSHDINGVFSICSKRMSPPQSIDDIKNIHASITYGRDIPHGIFKTINNRVGMNEFVRPEHLTGTLKEGLNMLNFIPDPVAKAIFSQFLIAECHPFIDGNGRLSRLIMNSYLDEANLCRIIIPTILRDDYILALKRLSTNTDPSVLIKVMDKAYHFTSEIDFSTTENAVMQLNARNAFSESRDEHIQMESGDAEFSI